MEVVDICFDSLVYLEGDAFGGGRWVDDLALDLRSGWITQTRVPRLVMTLIYRGESSPGE